MDIGGPDGTSGPTPAKETCVMSTGTRFQAGKESTP
jgi:hypothetical protein